VSFSSNLEQIRFFDVSPEENEEPPAVSDKHQTKRRKTTDTKVSYHLFFLFSLFEMIIALTHSTQQRNHHHLIGCIGCIGRFSGYYHCKVSRFLCQ
jgi:hypothetical protein